jgi:hypothetical protein
VRAIEFYWDGGDVGERPSGFILRWSFFISPGILFLGVLAMYPEFTAELILSSAVDHAIRERSCRAHPSFIGGDA